jgi:hypothetical protein
VFSVLGIDLSSSAIDLVCLDENCDTAEWARITLLGQTPFERCRTVAELMPQPGWYETRGVYLVAVERPRSRFFVSLAAQLPIFGAVVAALPDDLPAFELAPTEWRQAIGLAGNCDKDTVAQWARETWALAGGCPRLEGETQDTWDAYCVAYAARELNRRAIEKKMAVTA